MCEIKINPFVDRYDHEMIGQDRRTVVEKIYDSIVGTSATFNSFETAQPKIIVVKAGYGIGKTYTSFFLKNKIFQEKDCVVSTFRLVYDQSSGVNVSNSNFISKILSNVESNKEIKELISDKVNKNIGKININTDFKFLFDFCKQLYSEKIKNLVVQVDEVEDLLSAGTSKAVKYLTMIRNLYDIYIEEYSKGNSATPISILLYLSPEAWDLIMMHGENNRSRSAGAGLNPLITRIGQQIYSLREFDKVDTQAFMVLILNKAREQSDKLDPFNKEVIDALYMITRGNPRRILTHCHDLVSNMLKEKKNEINIEDFKHYCKEKNIDSPLLDTESDEDETFYGNY